MCFGLRNAAQTFQRLVNSILAGLDFVFAYVDDVLIASVSAEQHVEHVRTVLGRFEEFGIDVNPAKCVFAADSLTFLGHVVDAQGLRPNPDSATAIRQWPQPKTKKGVATFPWLAEFLPSLRRGRSQNAGGTIRHRCGSERTRRPAQLE